MPVIEIVNTYEKCRERTYEKIPFELPSEVESITLSYDYDTTCKHTSWKQVPNCNSIDLSLIGPSGELVGCSERSKSSVFISAHYATPGYIPQEIAAGTWNILIGFDKMKKEGVTVKFTVDYRLKYYRFLRGDPHTHTLHSDGEPTMEQLTKRAKKAGLDWIVITDHNVPHVKTAIPTYQGFLAMRGIELTNYTGHVNMWGVAHPFKGAYNAETSHELKDIITEAHRNGAVVSVNHPTCKECGFHLPIDDFPFDCAEVWNGPIMRIDNMTAIEWWHKELLQGKRLAAVGGSDYHRDYIITRFLGHPTTAVFAKSLSETDIVAALKKGACYITSSPKTCEFYLTSGSYGMGDEVKLVESTSITLFCSKLRLGQRIVVYNNDEIIYEYKGRGTYTVELKNLKKGFVRAEILYDKTILGKLVYHQLMKIFLPPDVTLPVPTFAWALTNPIYLV